MPDGTTRKVKKRVIKKEAAHKLLEGSKIKGSSKFMYFDENGNLVVMDKEPADSSKFEKKPWTTFMVSNRLSRIQGEIDKLEQKGKKVLQGD